MRATADFAPQHAVAYGPLRGVVRRFNASTFHEKPYGIKELQELGASSGCLWLFASFALGQ